MMNSTQRFIRESLKQAREAAKYLQQMQDSSREAEKEVSLNAKGSENKHSTPKNKDKPSKNWKQTFE